MYDETTKERIHGSNSGCPWLIDVWVGDAATNADLAIFRIITSTTGAQAAQVIDLTDSWHTYDTQFWIDGYPYQSGKYCVQFDKENLFSSQVTVWGGTSMRPMDTEARDFKAAMASDFANVNEVFFKICGDSGWASEQKIIVKSLNGQSFANAEGKFDDTKIPTLNVTAPSNPIEVDVETTVVASAYDLFGEAISYSLTINDNTTDGLKFIPTTPGELEVKVNATDKAGNVASKTIIYNVDGEIDLNDKVAISGVNPTAYLGMNEETASFVKDGIQVKIPGADTKGDNAWQYTAQIGKENDVINSQFSIANGNRVKPDDEIVKPVKKDYTLEIIINCVLFVGIVLYLCKYFLITKKSIIK